MNELFKILIYVTRNDKSPFQTCLENLKNKSSDKSYQKNDVLKAKRYWQDYKERKNG